MGICIGSRAIAPIRIGSGLSFHNRSMFTFAGNTETNITTAASAPSLPTWNPTPDSPLAEAQALRDVLQILLAHREALKIQGTQVGLLTSTLDQLEHIVARGTFTPAERSRIVRVAQLILYTVL